jgi:hypothetical protein
MIGFIKGLFGQKQELPFNAQCEKCPNFATYRFRPLSGPFEEHRRFLCAACVPHGCECNSFVAQKDAIDDILNGKKPDLVGKNGMVKMDLLEPYLKAAEKEVSMLPCCEYAFSENGWSGQE